MLSVGTEMASTRALSADLSLNPMTISKAYSLLEREGVLERRRGQTLVIRAAAAADRETNKLHPLRQHLASAAVMARQLGISQLQKRSDFSAKPSIPPRHEPIPRLGPIRGRECHQVLSRAPRP